MASVDFSNAIIEPLDLNNPLNPTRESYVSLNTAYLYAWNSSTSSWSSISSNASKTLLVNDKKQLLIEYQGTLNASGTEFYIKYQLSSYTYGWKISNISFNSGDTYLFQINATLVCE